MKIIHGDSAEVLQSLPQKSFDFILTDPPYGLTQNSWDADFNVRWFFGQFWKLLKPNGVVVVFSQQPFTTEVIGAQKEFFRYELIWDKVRPTGFLDSKRRPLKSHENILIFYKKLGTYNPQFTMGEPTHSRGKMNQKTSSNYGKYKGVDNSKGQGNKKFPKSILQFIKPHPAVHPTQKPVELCKWLIETYSNPGDTILDPFLGSGTTAIAAKETGRGFVGIEKEERYVNICHERLAANEINQ